MHTSLQLIELAKQRLALKHGLVAPITDYRLAKLMGLRTQTLSAWRNEVRGIGKEFAPRFAEACELPEAYVYACIELEREADPGVKKILEAIASAFRGKAAAWIAAATLAAGMSLAPAGNQAHAASVASPAYTLCARRKRRRPGLRERLQRLFCITPVAQPGTWVAA